MQFYLCVDKQPSSLENTFECFAADFATAHHHLFDQ